MLRDRQTQMKWTMNRTLETTVQEAAATTSTTQMTKMMALTTTTTNSEFDFVSYNEDPKLTYFKNNP